MMFLLILTVVAFSVTSQIQFEKDRNKNVDESSDNYDVQLGEFNF
jgi:hypothetical protein